MVYLSFSLYIIGPLSVAVMLLLMGSMGKRMGEALELPPYYRLYYVSSFFFLLPLPLSSVLYFTKAWGLPEPNPQTGLVIKIMVASLPMTVAIAFAVYATARYWHWIWGEVGQPGEEGGNKGGS